MPLGIALAIPASNDEKYNTTNSAGQGGGKQNGTEIDEICLSNNGF